MPKDSFSFRLFTIRQDRCAMKVGTDSILLGAWTDATKVNTILDVGTGTGILALLMAQRYPKAQITALEIDPQATLQAQENVNSSLWKERIKVVKNDFRMFTSPHTFDLILSNPPYFQDSLLSPDAIRSRARHTTSLSYQELLKKTASLLSPQGVFALILPAEYASEVRNIAFSHGLYTSRIAKIQTKATGNIKRTLMEFSFHLQLCHTEHLTLQTENGDYTTEFKELTKEFYLKQF